MEEQVRSRRLWNVRGRNIPLGPRTLIVGVLNVTPDSFSDGGLFLNKKDAVGRGLRLAEEGADILDVGGESSRPGAEPVSSEEERERVLPVIEALRDKLPDILLSVDTYKASVAAAALERGADIVNDVSALRFDEQLPEVVAESGAGLVLMHMRGTPAVMQTLPPSPDILNEIRNDLQVAVSQAVQCKIPRERIVLDPGIGFGKSVQDNLRVIKHLRFLRDFELPVMVGTSRKSFLGKIMDVPVNGRLLGTAATCVAAILNGADLLRVHDVKQIREAASVIDAMLSVD